MAKRRNIFEQIRNWFRKRSKKEDQETLIPLMEKRNYRTFTEIEGFIHAKDYEKAQSELEYYELEEISQANDSEVQRLYEVLETHMWSNMKATKPTCEEGPRLIASVYRVTENEEDRDEMRRKKTEGISPGRPREWRKQFIKLVEEYVEKEVSKCKHRIVKEYLSKVQKAATDDLLKLRALKEKEIVRMYAKNYHACIFRDIDKIGQTDLKAEELFSIFKWVMNESKGITDIADTHKLDPGSQGKWEEKLKKAVQWEIKEVIRTFGKENVPNNDPLFTIKEKLDNFRNNAKEINKNLSLDIGKMCTEELIGFIPRFIKCMKSSKPEHKVNSCVCFREYLTVLTDNQAEDNSNNLRLLKETQNKSCDKLLEYLFGQVKVNLKKNFQEDEVLNSDRFNSVEKSLRKYFHLRSKDNQKVHQALVDRAHIWTVQKYIQALLRTSTSNDTSLLTAKIKEESERLEDLFVNEFKVTSGEDVIWLLADIIESNDVEASKVMIYTLISEHPDISKRHVYALLHINGNKFKSRLRDTVKDAMKLRGTHSTCNALFDGIKVKSSCTIL